MTIAKFYPKPYLSDIFEDFFGNDRNPISNRVFKSVPPANIVETAEDFKIELVVPGYKRDDLIINLDKNVLSVSADQKEEKEEKNENEKVFLKEYSCSHFERRFTLPDAVETDKIEASYSEGILSLRVPKKDEAKEKPARQIFIN